MAAERLFSSKLPGPAPPTISDHDNAAPFEFLRALNSCTVCQNLTCRHGSPAVLGSSFHFGWPEYLDATVHGTSYEYGIFMSKVQRLNEGWWGRSGGYKEAQPYESNSFSQSSCSNSIRCMREITHSLRATHNVILSNTFRRGMK